MLKMPLKHPQHEVLGPLLQSIENVSRNSVGIRNLLPSKYSEITHPVCLHKLRLFVNADFIGKSI